MKKKRSKLLASLLATIAVGGSAVATPSPTHGEGRAAFPRLKTGAVANGRIAYQGNDQINTVRPDGTGKRKITHGPGDTGSVEFSPDGKRIVFTCDGGYYSRRPAQEICIADRDGSNLVELTDDKKADGDPSWSPDGEYIVFTKLVGDPFEYDTLEIFKMRSDGSDVVQLTSNDFFESSPDFSPDGTRIIYESYAGLDSGIWSMAPDGSDQMVLIDQLGYEGSPEWSPDGEKIAYHLDHRIKVFDLSTLQTLERGEGLSPTWSPDGRWIAYSAAFQQRGSGLRKVRVADNKDVLVIAALAFSPNWGPRL